ncbi:MAG: hypothetical protein KDA28_03840, partial [Phycisphaerales bacterium]|nr:hypothetical protein [Phycisphaerales bacterium]
VNLDTLVVRLDEAKFQLDVHDESISWLPPNLQSLASTHELQGDLEVSVQGLIPLQDLGAGEASASVSLTEATFAFDEYRIPVRSLSLGAALKEGVVRVPDLVVEALAGRIEATASLNVASSEQKCSAKWSITDLDLNEAMRAKDAESAMAGIVTSEGSALFHLAEFKPTVTGTGGVRIRDGRLVFIPGLLDLVNLVKPDTEGLRGRNHRLDAQFSFEEGGIRVDNSELVTRVIAARATGLISWEQELDLSVNAGPLEKLQSMLGEVGNLLGKVTDQLVKYRVRGPISDPKVSVAPLGVGG